MSRKILVTGAAGRIGSCVAEGLKASGRYEVTATDIHADPARGVTKLDVTDGTAVEEALRGIDTVLHFGWAKDEEDFLGKVLPVNVTGAYHIYEGARKAGVSRVIFASSNHATGFYKVGEEITPEDHRPDSFYGLSKSYIELLGRLYADKYGVSSFNIRIGNFPGDDRPHSDRAAHIWISRRDMVQLAECCIEADASAAFLSLYGTSANEDNYYDIGYLKEQIGYAPQDNAADVLARYGLREEELKQEEGEYQGGPGVRRTVGEGS
ncbi:NAD(P)-dependent oxidoreductase [Paenibacillus sp. JX-17]|uniref:NAD(P)-dependent oxidoreductase n=1 Tax=Paenibacillus lacisoli TaxID=3064525 RepID=A0ABT9CC70_9BACL|nr:NAD(P)-dependent oxidoreductase [Paenibacillus sp. JX-17]MDO7906860.1 NAD(P)-dependent oxidoreductase [Paenibacillus sp. JX-17]